MAVERHLRRVAERLPAAADQLVPMSDASDAVGLHLWQSTQIVIDLAMSACLALSLGTPNSYGDAFRRLEQAQVLDKALAARLVRAAGFRNVVANAYDTLDMTRVHRAAQDGNRRFARVSGHPARFGCPGGLELLLKTRRRPDARHTGQHRTCAFVARSG